MWHRRFQGRYYDAERVYLYSSCIDLRAVLCLTITCKPIFFPPGLADAEGLLFLAHPWRACRNETERGLVQAGEDEDLKRMMWVVENLQEELLTADEARMAADQQVQSRSKVVQNLQVCFHTRFPQPHSLLSAWLFPYI